MDTHGEACDLRTDAVTTPSPEMRAAMAAAPVGDDQFGEDPSVNLLQERVADLLGKEAALFVPSGTMSNQVALRVLTRPGDDVVVSHEAHAVWHETGGSAANAGVQFTAVGARGVFTADDFLAARKPRDHAIFPPTTLVEVENTHNRAGGIVVPRAITDQVCAAARAHDVATFLDGARIFNASVASGEDPTALAAPFDMVTIALSKGLGGPSGSVLAGTKDLVHRAVRHRRMLGGAMRQVGILAAAGLYALDHNVDQLVTDHANARLAAEVLAASDHIDLDLDTVHTNIVVFHLPEGAPDAATLVEQARQRGVLVFAFGPRTVRATTHRDVSREQCERAAHVLVELAEAA